MKTHLVLLALIALAVPLFADSLEYPIGATVPAPAPLWRRGAVPATDGTDFFVVWADSRTPGRTAIMGTRVKRNGQVLDPYGIRITSVPAGMGSPAAVWDGDAYVVVWTQGMYFGDTLQRYEVWTTRVDRDGRVLTAPRLVAEDAATTQGHYVESNGSVTVIAYAQVSSPGTAHIALLDREGNVVHRESLGAYRAPNYHGGFSVAASPSRFVITWSTGLNPRLFAVALGNHGRVVRPLTEIGAGEDPVIASNGSTFTIVTRTWMPDDNEWVLMSRTIDEDLAPIGDAQPLANDQVIESVSLLWRGDRYEVIAGHQPATRSTYGLLSIELDRDGDNLGSRSRRGDPLFHWTVPRPVAVTNGTDVLVAYNHPASYSNQIVARVYHGSSPEPDAQQLLSWSDNAHTRPAITSNASGHLAAWVENTNIYATRIDANGNSLDGRGVEITKSGAAVRLAFDGTNYVLAWLDAYFIGVRWIAPATGATIVEAHAPAQALPWNGLGLAVSPGMAYITWVDDRVRMARVFPAPRGADFPVAVSPEGMAVANPAIAWNGSTLLVAWNEVGIPVPFGDLPNTRPMNVQAARVSTGLSVLDPPQMLVATAGRFSLGGPVIASNGEDWLVVTDLDDQHILARRVLRSGSVAGAAETKIGDGAAPAVAWDGTRYAITYKSGEDYFLPQHPLLLGSVPATGALPMMRRALVANGVVSPPSIARTPTGDVSIMYTKVSPFPEHTGVERSWFRTMDFDPMRRRHPVR